MSPGGLFAENGSDGGDGPSHAWLSRRGRWGRLRDRRRRAVPHTASDSRLA